MFDPTPAPVDVVVIGMGASGALAASRLALAGRSVVGLDAGTQYEAGQFTVDELTNDRRGWLVQHKTKRETPTVRATDADVAVVPPRAQLMMNAVGGSKIHSGCGSVRFMPWHFTPRSSTIARYGEQALPADSTVVDWPYGYEELAPFYDKVEALFGVAGRAGNIRGEIQPGGNPFEGPRSGPFQMPPLRQTGYTRLMEEAAYQLGWHPYPPPAAVNSVPHNGRPACTYCGNCTHNGCWTDAKGLVHLNGLPEGQATGNLQLITGARVTEILTDKTGTAVGVAYLKDGRRHEQRSAVVLLAGFVYENVRLLLLSRSPQHPHGLANGNGAVGRHFSTHTFRISFAEFGTREMNTWSGATGQTIAVDDFNADNFDHTGLDFIGGGRIAATMEKKLLNAGRMPPPGVGRWGAQYKRWLAENLRSVVSVGRTIDEMPQQDAYLDLDPTHTDTEGFPRIRVTRRWSDNDIRQSDFLKAKTEEWLTAAGATRVWHGPDNVQNVAAHAYGGTRMGHDPATNVVDQWGFSHEVPNLGILGPSTFPTISGLAPVLTIEATTWRTAEHLINNWDSIAGAAPRTGHPPTPAHARTDRPQAAEEMEHAL
jgi:gluconate 2-dehydrogenase alpha chain